MANKTFKVRTNIHAAHDDMMATLPDGKTEKFKSGGIIPPGSIFTIDPDKHAVPVERWIRRKCIRAISDDELHAVNITKTTPFDAIAKMTVRDLKAVIAANEIPGADECERKGDLVDLVADHFGIEPNTDDDGDGDGDGDDDGEGDGKGDD